MEKDNEWLAFTKILDIAEKLEYIDCDIAEIKAKINLIIKSSNNPLCPYTTPKKEIK